MRPLSYSRGREKREWLSLLTKIQPSVVPAILPRVMFCALFALVINILYELGIERLSLDVLGSVVPSIVLALLLVFRTNTAYDRFWEGRKLWGTLINTVRNLARTIWVSIPETTWEDREEKVETLRLLVAFAVATKLKLRSEAVNSQLANLMSQEKYDKLQNMNHPPLEIAFWIADYLGKQHTAGKIDGPQLTGMFRLVDVMVDILGGCERILKTPIPLAYSIHLRQLLLLYCLALPFQIVDDSSWLTAPLVFLISFTVFGIEEIGVEIENPFGYDPNDLPLDLICETMEVNINDLMSMEPSAKYWQK